MHEVVAARPAAPQAPAPAAQPKASGEAAAIDGMWKLVLATPLGPQTFTGRFATDGGVITGMLYSGDLDPAGFTGTLEGNHAVWDLKVTKPISLTLKYDVQFEGDTLAGKVKMGIFGKAKLSGERMPG